ncbi:MAG: menaquinone biosynthesis protein [Rikenellaceae bacterium]
MFKFFLLNQILSKNGDIGFEVIFGLTLNIIPIIWTMAIIPKIAAVSYLNTIPFIYGIEKSNLLEAELLLSPPSECLRNYIDHKVDIALLPVAAVPHLEDTQIISDYCIGSQGAVRSVVIVSDDPITSLTRIWLDPHSKTSVQLAGYLAENHWHISPEWVALDDYSRLNDSRDGEGFLLIGDKVFEHEGEFEYSYDLSAEWAESTSMPFTFAVWVARKGTPEQTIDSLNEALTFGIEHTFESILEYRADGCEVDYYEYLTENIDFIFDGEKRRALQKFWDAGIKIAPKTLPG